MSTELDKAVAKARLLQNRAYYHGHIDSEDHWSDKKYRDVADASTSALREVESIIRALIAERDALKADAERLRGVLRMVAMLRNLGGMLPGSAEVVQAIVEAADAAMKPQGSE